MLEVICWGLLWLIMVLTFVVVNVHRHRPRRSGALDHAQHVWEMEREIGWEPSRFLGLDPPAPNTVLPPAKTVSYNVAGYNAATAVTLMQLHGAGMIARTQREQGLLEQAWRDYREGRGACPEGSEH